MKNPVKNLGALPFLSLLTASLAAQTPFVKITSPEAGTVVRPGQSLTITVDATPSAFRAMFVLPFASVEDASSKRPPWVFTIQIRPDLASAVYPVEVMGVPSQV